MSDVVQFKKTAKRRWSPSPAKPLVVEIVDALHDLGGQAHRDVVFNYINAKRSNTGEPPTQDFIKALMAAFDDHLDSHRPGARMLHLPFGAGSRRWALSHEAVELLRQRSRVTRLT